MARPLRVEFPGAVYHVTSRGNARKPIYLSDSDRYDFLDILHRVVQRYHWLCHSYCLMGNHYHFLFETPEANLSRGMRQLNGIYTQSFNRRHRRVGHLFQGRYKAQLVEHGSYLLEVARYIVLNPVRAKMVRSPADYKWSSYRSTVGLRQAELFLSTVWILGQFASNNQTARRRYRVFVRQGMNENTLTGEIKNGVILGSEAFIQTHGLDNKKTRLLSEVPRVQRFAGRPDLSALFTEPGLNLKTERDRLIRIACEEYGYTMTEVARHLGLHYSTVSKILKPS
jgi:REP element-mobilizing transposase RayT